MTTEERLRIQQTIHKYLKTGLFEDYTHVELADLILDKEEIPIAHRTLRRYISEERGESTIIRPYLAGNKNNVLVIGDTHFPFEREGYLEHCRSVQEEFDCGTVIHIGDEVDNHAISYHETDNDGDSAGSEFAKSMIKMKQWYKMFPEVTVIVGNHSALPFRKAKTAGLSRQFLKAYEDIWEAPSGWKWKLEHVECGVLYTHGTSVGEKGAINMAMNRRQSVVMGHNHTCASIIWNVSQRDKIFGMFVGCGIDDSQYAFEYARNNIKKSIVSCAVVKNGILPIIIPMEL